MKEKPGSVSPRILLAAVTLLASLLSFLHIGSDSLWFDEANSIYFAKLPWSGFVRVVTTYEANQGLYYLLLRCWLLLGDSEPVARALSALFAIGTVPILYLASEKLSGPRNGLVAALLLSLNAFFLHYAQEARGYSLLLFCSVLATYLFIRLAETPSDNRVRCAYILVGALSVYVHFFAALVLLAHFCTLPFLPADGGRDRKILAAYFVVGLLVLPIVYFILTKDLGQIDWIRKPTLGAWKGLFRELSGNAADKGYNKELYLAAGCVAACCAAAAVFRSGRSVEAWRYALMFSVAGVPPLVTFAVSFHKPIFQEKYLIVMLPGLVMIAAAGISSVRNRLLFAAVLCLFAASSTVAVFRGYYPRTKENYRDAVSYVVSASRPGDGIIVHDQDTILPVGYYLDRYTPGGTRLDCVYPAPLGQYDYLKTYPTFTEAAACALKEKYGGMWLFLRNYRGGEIDPDTARVVSALSGCYARSDRRNFGNLAVWRFAD
jgi:4-amino-4-deoxy-L-arabinose transferase-like glycosyltransferase